MAKVELSAVLKSQGLDYVQGYAPARNVQQALRIKVKEIIAARQGKQGVLKKPVGNLKPAKVSRIQEAFERDSFVRDWVLQQAAGNCELCGKAAPFLQESGEPYLEVHHVIPLSERGSDTPENCVALCPNCHRAMHHSAEAKQLVRRIYTKVARLARNQT